MNDIKWFEWKGAHPIDEVTKWHRNEYCYGCGAMATPNDPCVCKRPR
jgi:hypothetical protein